MNAHALVLAALVVSCNNPRHLDETAPCLDAAPGAPRPPPRAACDKTHQQPRELRIDTLEVVDPSSAAGYLREVTIRVLATQPLLFQIVDQGADTKHWDFLPPMSTGVVVPEVARQLAGIPFGEPVRAQIMVPPIMNSSPPLVLVSVKRSAPPAGAAALVAQWVPDPGTEVVVHADGRVMVRARGHVVNATLSQAELDGLLEAFGTAGFDALPAAPQLLWHVGHVVLACQRYQQVDIDANRAALAPALSAFERIRDQTLARAQTLIRVEKRRSHAQIVDWPADAPPVARLYDLRNQAEKAPPGDHSSPLYRKLSPDLVADIAAAKEWHVVVRDGGERWEIYEQGCVTCVPGTYSMIRTQPVTFEEAPDDAPDLASIGEEGLFLDAKTRSPIRVGSGAYRQRDVIYMVHVSEAVPNMKR
jgi:hypothetical protein